MRPVRSLIAMVMLLAACAPPCEARQDRRDYALSLLQEGRRRLEIGSIDQRRMALGLFEHAALVAPKDPEVLVALGDAYADARYLHRARTVFERADKYSPGNADVHFGFARLHRREWLEFAWPEDLRAAIDECREAVRLRSGFVAVWAALSALEVEAGSLERAGEAAERAFAAGPQVPEARLVAAELAYRNGNVARADSLFGDALAAMDPAKSKAFHDVSPLIPLQDARSLAVMTPARREEWVRRFWSANDPDPVTPENEARLEYWARQSHALVLLGDPWGPIWRERTAVYVRYGRHVQIDDPMRSRHYEMPRLDLGEVAATPTRAQLERINRVTAGDGQSAFAPLAPGVVPLPLAVRVMRFHGETGSRVLAQIESPGTRANPLQGECVVFDAEERLVTRARRAMATSACDPLGGYTGDFEFALPAGSYRLAFAVSDSAQHRGVRRVFCDLAPPTRRLTMSELAPNCGPPELATGGGTVRLLPNPRVRVTGEDPLVAYFEIYGLRTDSKGTSRFEYEYQVHALGAPGIPWYKRKLDGDAAAKSLAFQTAQEGQGPLRRQFIRVPTRVLPAGRYLLEITVRDVQSGESAKESLPFSRLWSEAELWGAPASP